MAAIAAALVVLAWLCAPPIAAGQGEEIIPPEEGGNIIEEGGDTTPPETSITSAPADPTNETEARFELSASEQGSTFQCRLGSGDWTSCSSPTLYSGLSPGAHNFEARATDQAGNADPTPASHGWTVDTTGPATTIDPPALLSVGTDDTMLTGTAADDLSPIVATTATIVDLFGNTTTRAAECLAGCGTPTVAWRLSTAGLTPGFYTVTASSDDLAGNGGPQSEPVSSVIANRPPGP
jgi:hypothetical protein